MKNILWVIVFSLLFSSCQYKENNACVIMENSENTVEENYGTNMTVSRALASKMISILFIENKNCSGSHFKDVEKNTWYYDYANLMFENNIMVGNEGCFTPLEPIKYIEAMKIIKRLGGADVKYNDKNGNKPISYDAWLSMIEELAKKKNIELKYDEIPIFAIGNGENTEIFNLVTDKEIYDHAGFYLNGYEDKKIMACTIDKKIVAIKNIVSDQIIYENADIHFNKNNTITVELNGVKRNFNSDNYNISDGKHNVTINNGEIIKID